MSPPVSVLLFDLGGVLIDFSGLAELNALLPEPIADAELVARWSACPHSLAYGAGQLSTEDFLTRFREHWGITMEPDALLEAWKGWVRGWLPGAEALLAELRPRYRLAALSNSNEAHWERLASLRVLDAFDLALGSHQLGLRKPAAATYREVLARLEAPGSMVLFLDDSLANVEAARQSGLEAAHVHGPAGVRRHLAEAGLL